MATLSNLLVFMPEGSYQIIGDQEIEIHSIAWDYKKVDEKCLYFCLQSEEFQETHIRGNSLNHWEDAVEAGASCLVIGEGVQIDFPPDITIVKVSDLNRSHSLISKAFYKDSLSNMQMIGITGTNGKTTTSQLTDSILLEAGKVSGVIGTIGVFYPSKRISSGHLSNPLASDLFSIGEQMHLKGVETCVMEITSHAMDFDRNFAVDFDVAVFTNLTQDHLDHHKTFEAYKKAKIKHFSRLGTQGKKAYAVVNIDDAYGNEFVSAIDKGLIRSGKVNILTFGIKNKDAALVAYPRQMTGNYSEFDLFLRGDYLCSVELPMPGLFNIYNGIAAFGATFTLGLGIEQIVNGLAKARQAEGRFEQVECDCDYDVYIDYAHTPDALQKILEEIRKLTRNKVICVYGCGGDRDRSKRPKMGQIASENADTSIITSDNPRNEDPQQICREILAGIKDSDSSNLFIEEDRREAIHLALDLASKGDSVLIAGKGHERYQIIGNKKFEFSDRLTVQEFFESRVFNLQRAWIQIDTNIIRKNLQLIKKDKAEELKLMIVVKDNALGHGIVEVARIIEDEECDYLGVAFASEALKLRHSGIDTLPILVFGETSDDNLRACIRENITLQIQSVAKAKKIGVIAGRMNKVAKVHFKVDTGMGRYGEKCDQVVSVINDIHQLSGVEMEGLMTHFAQSDELDKSYANLQWQRFQDVLKALNEKNLSTGIVHTCNTGGYLDLPDAHCDMVRLGTLPMGVYPSDVCRRIDIKGEKLEAVMSVTCQVAYLKNLEIDESVGYGMHFKADAPLKTAVLPIGYGDGYPRLRNRGHVLINGEIARIIGGNGMDATMVDISSISDVEVGDEVVMLGKQGSKEITARMLAEWATTVTYEVLSLWTDRMERSYI
ncbi:MAG: UDP-N-acetylmuramoyl-L-alanyl-D-glutamate--2,6-diaminopimelate ligase [Proteobacteria bacterium]|nr:UDP-N-acetylmuramoyl-L-alanyl-D-glutamate--2,6-diaminopimelate ligase [Pseudomonadota bacterium]